MATMIFPPRETPLSNSPTSSYASSRSPTPPSEVPQTPPSKSFVQTMLGILQTLQATIWIYIVLLQSVVRKYIEQYRSKGFEKQEVEKTPEKRGSIPEIVGRSRTGTNIRELVMGGGSKRGSMDISLKSSGNGSGNSSESERRPVIKSTKGTGFDEPFCKFRNTTRTYPGADLSPNASISAPDIAPKAHQYHRMRMPGRRSSNKNVSHGKILPSDAGFASGGRLGQIAVNESAMGSSLEGLYDDIVYEDGTKAMTLTKTRTDLSGSTSVGSPVDRIMEYDIPRKDVEIPSVKVTIPDQAISAAPSLASTSDWEGETSKALERIMSPLSRHPVTMTKHDSPNSTHTTEKFGLVPTRTSSNVRPSTAPAAPVIKPGGFRRISVTPQHSKKDSGIGFSRFDAGGSASSSDRFGGGEEYEESETPTKRREKGFLKRLKIQKP